MGMKQTRRVGTFRATSEDGRTYFVHEFQEFIDAGTKDSGGVDWIPGMGWFELTDGSKLNYIDEETLELVRDGTILKRQGSASIPSGSPPS